MFQLTRNLLKRSRGTLPTRSALGSFGYSVRGKQTAVFSWGIGSEGQLGHQNFTVTTRVLGGENYIQMEPRRMVKSKRFSNVACGDSFSLGLTNAGELFGWGKGFAGEESQSNVPVPITLPSGAATIKEIFAGAKHAAAIDENGHVLTWGFGGSWFKGGGQLGHGDTSSKELPTYVESFKDYGSKAVSISLGSSHTLLLTEDGEVLSCGIDDYGRLGTGASGNATTPEPLVELVDETIVQAKAGNAHSIALSENGKVFTWGRNDAGQLGHGDSYIDIYSMEEFPRAIDNDELKKQTVSDVIAGYQRCGALTHEGNLFVWGIKLSHVPSMVDRDAMGGMKIVAAGLGGKAGGMAISMLAEDGSLWTIGDRKSNMLGMKEPPSRLADAGKVDGAWMGKVLSVSTGPGQHQACIAEME